MIVEKEKGFAPLLIVLLIFLIVSAGLLGYQAYRSQITKNRPLTKKTVVPRSKAPGVISAAITAHGYNPKTGSAIQPDKYFSSKDNQLYLLMNVNKPKVGTHIEYVRYLQGRYLDHQSIKVTQPNWKYTHFSWSNKPGKIHKKGIYRVRLYTNGILEKKVNYIVRDR